MAKRLLTVPQVAAILNCSRGTVYNLIGRQALRHVRIGRLIRVSEVSLLVYINEHDPVSTTSREADDSPTVA